MVKLESAGMYDHNQIDVPAAFMALYCRHGRPVESRPVIEARYEICEAIAEQVAAFCRDLQLKAELDESQVLLRCRAGLLAAPESMSGLEVDWVMGRCAELLNWPLPLWPTKD